MKCDRSPKRDAWLHGIVQQMNETTLALQAAGLDVKSASVLSQTVVMAEVRSGDHKLKRVKK